ncbi:MAG: hypothetical protein IT385_14750 [Deltaproteobacteria bacterium]|nr:hypothetical protein [Deltaproteobacteria bacterium]
MIEKPDCKGSFNGSKLSAAKMLDGDPSDAWSGDPLKLAPPEKSPVEKPFGWKKEGKLAVKGCQNVPWSLF